MSGVALSSLRVSSDFDASAYIRGAAQMVAADQQMIPSKKVRRTAIKSRTALVARNSEVRHSDSNFREPAKCG